MMNPRVKEVYPHQDYTIKVIFDNGEEKMFDVSPYLDKGIFSELKNKRLFATVKPFLGSVQWKNGQDFCPDTLYIPITNWFSVFRTRFHQKFRSFSITKSST